MSPKRAWLTFERQGGRPPRDDETLFIQEDGAFAARRTVGGRSIGTFKGRCSSSVLRRLSKAADSLSDASDVEIPTPHLGATEVLVAAGQTLTSGSNETAPKPWRSLQRVVRGLLQDDVLQHPAAAIRLVADLRSARLEHAGEHEIEVDRGSIEVEVVHRAADETIADRWTVGAAAASAAWVTTGPGWSAELPFEHGFRLQPGEWLQVRVELAIRDADGRRDGRLYAPVIPDA